MTESDSLVSPVGLIAGNGIFPLEFAKNAAARGLAVVAIAHRGETNPDLEGLVKKCVWIRVGQFGKLLGTLQRERVNAVAFAGGIRRTKLFSGVKLDLKGISVLLKAGSMKDDAVLRAIAREIERAGIKVISASIVLPESLPGAGVLGSRQLSASEVRDALVGWQAAKAIGACDIGQTVVVKQGVIVAVEAVEGTDAAIQRAGDLAGAGCVVVKICKPDQDQRFDLPTIGLGTICTMEQSGATAIILEAGRAIVLNPVEVVREANRADIAIRSVNSESEL